MAVCLSEGPGRLGARPQRWVREGNGPTSPSAASIRIDLSALAKEVFCPTSKQGRKLTQYSSCLF